MRTSGGNGDDCRALARKPSEYFRNQLYIDSMIFREAGLRNLVAEVGVDHIFYGTDYPFDWPVNIDFILNARSLTDAQKDSDPRRQSREAPADQRVTRE